MAIWPFNKRVPKVYNPNAPRMKWEFIPVMAIIILSVIGLWVISYMFGIGGIAPVGPILMVVLFALVVLLALTFVKQRWEGKEASDRDFALILILVILLVLGYIFLPKIAPELFAQSIASLKTSGLQAFLKP